MASFNPLEHPICLSEPERLAPSAWTQHIPFAMLLVDLLRPSVFVELGTFAGASYCAFCQAVKELAIECRCYAIDTWEGDNHAGHYGSEVLADLAAHHDRLYASFSSLVRSSFDDACEKFADGSIDLLHIDGYHTYEAVQHDFELWLPKMSDCGVVVFHDIAEHRDDFGVWKLWSEIEARFPNNLAFYHGHGLGIVAVGNYVPEPARQLFDLRGPARSALRALMSELGMRIELQQEDRYLRSEKQRLEGQVTFLSHEMKQQIAQKDEMIIQKDEVISTLEQQAAKLAEEVERLDIATRLTNEQRGAALESMQNALIADRDRLRNELAFVKGTKAWRLSVAYWQARSQGNGALVRLGAKTGRKAIRRATRVALRRAVPASVRRHWGKQDYALVRASGLFDDEWYRASYTDVLPTEDALDHYLRQGFRNGHNPGPLFDGQWYTTRYQDIAAAGLDPLVHYVRYGAKEGREARGVGAACGEGESIPLSVVDAPVVPGSIAVVIHAFYPDVYAELCEYLHNIPCKFSLYVSTPSAAVRREVLRLTKKQAIDARVDVRVCPNRGRNFGPFLAEFADDVAQHDFVLHLHTKKSLYTGGEQETWRRDLYRTLIAEKQLVRATLNLFGERSDVGVIYPATSQVMPYWAHHWLSNGHLVPRVFERLGVEPYQLQGSIDYPVGGMFWARVEAVRPLFTAGFRYDDFPQEANQTDGTLAHVLERCITQIAKARGFGFIELDYANGLLRENRGARNLHQYLGQSPTTLRSRINEADLISFDIFDTVLMRPSKSPDAVLRYVGLLIQRRYPGADGFFDRRKSAEDAARKRKDYAGDVDIDEIYAEFALTDGWSASIVEAARDLELETELRMAQPRPAGVEAVRYAHQSGKRVIAISDTYLPRHFIEQLIARIGLAGHFDELYLSCERQTRKDRGDLWTSVMAAEKVSPNCWLHVGDNEQSDVQRPSDLGIGVFHVMNPTTLFALRGFDDLADPDKTRWGTDLVLGPVVNRIAGNPFLSGKPLRPLVFDSSKDIGYNVFGPLVFAFAAWMARHPTFKGVRHIYFLSREGHVLQQAYDIVRRHLPEERLPGSTYFLTSRRMALSAAQAVAFNPDDIMRSTGFSGSLSQLVRSRLGLVLPDDCGAENIEFDLQDTSKVVNMLTALKPYIVAHGASELDLYRDYCQSVGMTGDTPSALVDIGYSATIQRSLQLCLNRGFVGYYMATFKDADDVGRQGGYAFGCFSDGEEPWTSRAPLVKHSLIAEAFLCAPHGQVDGFVRNATGDIHPIFKPDGRSVRDLEVLSEMQSGALAYCDDVLQAYGPAVLDAEVELSSMQAPLRLLGAGETRIPLEVQHALSVEDDFSGTGTHRLGQMLVTG